ncbi:MAG TPA: pyridoxal-phosphate dependent enzyme, partial [Opitutaceae bacterium]|nr:pyridoxal-phosphate dependent enzyme [Opitutaceae bacterium]
MTSLTEAIPPILALIGNTPLMSLHFREENITLYAKAEFLNPSGSIKDRLAQCIVEDAERRGLLNRDSIIMEVTSGNTGIAFAMVGAAKGYRVRILMSDSASIERRHLMKQLGAELVLFKATRGYLTGIELAQEIAAKEPNCFLPRQFENPINA